MREKVTGIPESATLVDVIIAIEGLRATIWQVACFEVATTCAIIIAALALF